MFINNNAFTYGLTGSIEPGGTEPSTVKRSNKSKSTTYFYNNSNNNNNPPDLLEFIVNINLDELVNIGNLTVDINLLDYYFNNNR